MRTSISTLSLITAFITTAYSTSSLAFFDRHHDRPSFFEEQDANKDGKVSKEEAVVQAQKRFDAIDANHDGTITKEEITAYYDAKRKSHCNDDEKKD